MNDRFSAQVRQHLLDTADERPADGQLEMVVWSVAHTQQRHPLLARLTWNPGRIGLFPAAAVRFGLVAATLALAMVAGAVLAGGAGPTTVFDGTWTATDPGDGSVMILVVGPGNTPAVYFEDGYATGPACRNDVVKRFTARGTGEIEGNLLDVAFPDGGGCGLITVEMEGHFDYRAVSDTVVDQDGLVWARALGGDRSATQVPATEAPATQAPATQLPSTDAPATPPPGTQPTAAPEATPVWPPTGCVDFYEEGGTYRVVVGSISVTATVPAGWHGSSDWFYLVKAPCIYNGPLRIEAAPLTSVYADACHWRGTEVEATTPAAVMDALALQAGHETLISPDVIVGGYPATRFELSFPTDIDPSACDDGTMWLAPGGPLGQGLSNIDPGQLLTVYVVDVAGSAVVFATTVSEEEATAAQAAELAGIVAVVRFEP
jgi:hypothetical protein